MNRGWRVRTACCIASLALCALFGCSFTREVVNGYVRDLDTSWIAPGRTTRDEIIARMGRPPAVLGVGQHAGDGLSQFFAQRLSVRPSGMDAKGEDVDATGLSVFRWTAVDSREGAFEAGYWIVPKFSNGVLHRRHDILVLFDERGVVKLMSRTAVVDGKVRILEWKEVQ